MAVVTRVIQDGVFACSNSESGKPSEATCGVTTTKPGQCAEGNVYLEPYGSNNGGCVTGYLETSFDERTKAAPEELRATSTQELSIIPQDMAKQLEERAKKLGVTVTVEMDGMGLVGTSWKITVIDPISKIKYTKGWGLKNLNNDSKSELAIITSRLLNQVEIDRSRKVTLN